MSQSMPTETGEMGSLLGFPGWGAVKRLDMSEPEPVKVKHLDSSLARKLGQWRSTAICGNDITSSCLYVAALSALYAGPLAPLALVAVALLLYLFRSIYAEVGTALPLNGGAYNALLNTTSKAKASVAACLTLLSYLATAVISASEAMHYAHNLWGGMNVFWATIALPTDLAEQIRIIDRIYPEIRIDLVLVKGSFGPELIERLSRRLGVPKNYMFIGTPGDHFPHRIADLGGVRLIM